MVSINLFVTLSFAITFWFSTIIARSTDFVYPIIMEKDYTFLPTKDGGYHFKLETPNGSKREEVGKIIFPDTLDEHLVVMGTYSVIDDKTNTETKTNYTADKDGYKTSFSIQNRLSSVALKTSAG